MAIIEWKCRRIAMTMTNLFGVCGFSVYIKEIIIFNGWKCENVHYDRYLVCY